MSIAGRLGGDDDEDGIGTGGATTLITGYCGFGRLDVCNVNFETIVVAACGVERTLKTPKNK